MAMSLAAARVNAELTQAQVCERLNISKTTICSYEAYKTSPDMNMANKIADLYGCELDDIKWEKEK